MTSKARLGLFIACILSLAASSCADFTYSSTGRSWKVHPDEMISSDDIRARRDVTLSLSGRLDSGTVTARVYKDGFLVGNAITIHQGQVDRQAVYGFQPGLWSFNAQADGLAEGELYLSISDR